MRGRWVRLPLTGRQQRIADQLARLPESVHPEVNAAESWAAVAVMLSADADSVLLIRRAERVGDPWSGHVGLPGGRRDPDDPDLCATAVRETIEEVGVRLPSDALLGALPDVWPRTPLPRLIVVRSFVFALPSQPPLTLSDEVAQAFWVPLDDLTRPGSYRETVVSLRGEERMFPAYHLAQGVVWGLTERILTALLEV